MSKADAITFLHKMDTDPALKADVEKSHQQLLATAKKHGLHFNKEEINEALLEKWGPPKHREKSNDPYTCFCFSEPPAL
jgi:hypothetical protein